MRHANREGWLLTKGNGAALRAIALRTGQDATKVANDLIRDALLRAARCQGTTFPQLCKEGRGS